MSGYKIINLRQNQNIKIIGLVMMRNESLILHDTLDHLAQFVDGIIVFDDASTDNSLDIAKEHPKVLSIIVNNNWQLQREAQETRHRQALLELARDYEPTWMFYMDCDERFEGNIKEFLLSDDSNKINGVRISLFDAYLTPNDKEAYRSGKLYNFRKYFGPERRDILMIWRNLPNIEFKGLIQREPNVKGKIITKFYCQHYGKSLSVEHWESTCDFYIKYFSKYRYKWQSRKGKAIHSLSDFNGPLYDWQDVKANAIKINSRTKIIKIIKFLFS